MKSNDYLRAFKNRDLNREIDFAQAKWKEHAHHTFGDFAKWFENQSPPGCKLTIECMCDPELVKRLENIPLILIDPMWLAATGKAGVNIVTMFVRRNWSVRTSVSPVIRKGEILGRSV